VNPADERMLGGGGADGAIHSAAGPELLEACYKVPEVQPDVCCPTGEARITPGFKLPAAYVIHTVGPIYDSEEDPKASLTSAYKNCLSVAKENNIQYIAFTAISCGVYGYPFEEAATVAISTVKEYGEGIKEVPTGEVDAPAVPTEKPGSCGRQPRLQLQSLEKRWIMPLPEVNPANEMRECLEVVALMEELLECG
ncbi:Appr-1-p processing, partial [Corchorus capsularis]